MRLATKRDQERISELEKSLMEKDNVIKDEMASVKYWMAEYRELTDEYDENAAYHKKKMEKTEHATHELHQELNTAWSKSREESQKLRDKNHECSVLKVDCAHEKSKFEANIYKLNELLKVKDERIKEIDKTLQGTIEMVTALTNHSSAMLMERDEALDRLKQLQQLHVHQLQHMGNRGGGATRVL